MTPALSRAVQRKRRLFVSRWRRSTQWEFWPSWIFYAPLVPYLAYLGAKYGGMTTFTAAHPGIEGGGFVRESKFDILQGLAGSSQYVARAALIRGDRPLRQKIEGARRFMATHDVSCPVVLKPNYGQRGSGVVVVRSAEALETCLEETSADTIIQEHIGGLEFGIFYYRRPSEPRGRILSITEKQFPSVIGDGRRTLEQLILDDDRTVCAAPVYLERFKSRLHRVPATDQMVSLAELGTHCRGAMFLDGR